MVQKSGNHQLRWVVDPIIHREFYTPGGAGFLPSTVSHYLQGFVLKKTPRSLLTEPENTPLEKDKYLETINVIQFLGSTTNFLYKNMS